MRLAVLAGWISAFLLMVGDRLPAADEDPMSADEQTVRGAHIGTDGASLIRFLRQLTPLENQSSEIPELIRQLGHESFAKREEATARLMAIGPLAAPSLRQAALSPDPEVRRRAQGCLQQLTPPPNGKMFAAVATPLAAFRPQPGGLETLTALLTVRDAQEKSTNPVVISSAVRLLAARRPAGTARALLDYLPFVIDNSIGDEVEGSLAAVALNKGQPDAELLRGLRDSLGTRRSAAAVALCRAGGPPMAASVRNLLQDPDLIVRLRVAKALAEFGEAETIPILMALLDKLLPTEAGQAEDVLRQLAGDLGPAGPGGGYTAESWRKSRENWEAWWRGLDGRSLLQLFLRRTPGDSDRERMLTLVRELGDDDFAIREQATLELRAMGPLALPAIRQALKDTDPEVVQRAQMCKEQITNGWRTQIQSGAMETIGLAPSHRLALPSILHSVNTIEKNPLAPIPTSAARLVALTRPAGAAEVLLAYLPFAEDDLEVEEIQGALTTLAIHVGQADAALVRALDDKIAARRAAAGVSLCRARGVQGAPDARRLLRDPDPGVRLRLALTLADMRDKEMVPVLIDLLAELPDDQSWQAEDFLRRIARDSAPAESPGAETFSRRKLRDSWAAWWQNHGALVDLSILDRSPRPLGFTVVAEYTDARNGRVLEVAADGKIRWKVERIPWPLDVQVLPGQRLLLAEFYDNRVSERNFKGEVLWQKQLSKAPLTARRLASGNTLIVTQDQIMEVDRSGREVSTIHRPGVLAAEKLSGGRIASIDSAGTYSVIDGAGHLVKSFPIGAFQNYSGFQVLGNGGVVLPLTAQDLVVEYNAQGKRVWEASVHRPTSVVRLMNGHTLVSCRDSQLVVELDRSAKEVWRFKSTGYPWRAYHR
jgi:HEAT repeat protein